MRIGIDASPLAEKNRTGIGRFLERVLSVWSTFETNDEIFLISHREFYLDFKLPENWKVVIYSVPFKHLMWHQILYFELPAVLRKFNIDVFWGTNYTIPYVPKDVKCVLSIYDMATFRFPEVASRDIAKKLNRFTKSSAYRANTIVTISKSAKQDIASIFNLKDSKIFVNYIGGFTEKQKFYNGKAPKNNKLCFVEPFFLFIGTIEPRKNLEVVIKAYEIFRNHSSARVKLVLAGKDGWNTGGIHRAIDLSQYREDIVLPGYITYDEKEYLLSNASAFVFPSVYEGFGIPILEAFEYRLPTITSRVSSCPEVGGDAAFYLNDLDDVDELANLMKRILSLPECERALYQEKMRIQVGKFAGTYLEEELYNLITKK